MNQSWIEVLINWLPMLLLIGVWVFFLRRMSAGKYMSKWQTETISEMRRQNDLLERIATSLDKK